MKKIWNLKILNFPRVFLLTNPYISVWVKNQKHEILCKHKRILKHEIKKEIKLYCFHLRMVFGWSIIDASLMLAERTILADGRLLLN